MYRMIRQRQTVFESYLESMLALNEVTREEADDIKARRAQLLEDELNEARADGFTQLVDSRGGMWADYFGGRVTEADEPETHLNEDTVQSLLAQVITPPSDFKSHPRLKRLLANRQKMAEGTAPLDWGTAELVALAAVVAEGRQLRFTGQDVMRGTFSHRHAYLFDETTGLSLIHI